MIHSLVLLKKAMPLNYNAFLRYKTIHKCLFDRQNRQQYIDLCELMNIIRTQTGYPVKERTIREDLKTLRDPHNELGFVLPIKIKRNYGYFYPLEAEVPEDIMMPMDKELLRDISGILAQFTRFDFFEGYKTSLNILIDGSDDNDPIIQLDYKPESMGQILIPELRKAIKKKESILINYQSFRNTKGIIIPFQPRFIKIFNNRWFLVGYNGTHRNFDILPLDRIQSFEPSREAIVPDPEKERNFDPSNYFNDVIGVTVMQGKKAEDIIFRVNNERAQYINTKPIHSSQEIIDRSNEYIDFKVRLKQNPELISLLLSYGSDLEVMKPKSLREKLKAIAASMNKMYSENPERE